MAYGREGLGEARGRQFADPGGRLSGASLQRTARTRSADWDAVLQPALVPERVKAALDLERRTLADVALKDFAVVAHVLDDPHPPIVGQASGFAELSLRAEETFDLRVVRLRHLVDVGFGDAEFLRVQHRKVDPAHQIAPLIVAMAYNETKRLLGDDFRQHDVLVRVRGSQTFRKERRPICRESIAAAAGIGLKRLVRRGESDDLIFYVIRAKEVGEVQLGRGALLRADGSAIQLLG